MDESGERGERRPYELGAWRVTVGIYLGGLLGFFGALGAVLIAAGLVGPTDGLGYGLDASPLLGGVGGATIGAVVSVAGDRLRRRVGGALLVASSTMLAVRLSATIIGATPLVVAVAGVWLAAAGLAVLLITMFDKRLQRA